MGECAGVVAMECRRTSLIVCLCGLNVHRIQDDLHALSEATRKPPKKRRLDAISTQLNTLFFANERTNIANMAAFQKFFIDRMSVQSVHKDLELRERECIL